VNAQTFPALKIKDNLASEADHTDKYLYYSSSFQGKSFVCQQLIPIQSAVGEALKVLISVQGADGSGDNVLSNDNDWILFTANLLNAGISVGGDLTYQWQKLNNGIWENISSIASMQEVVSNTLKVYDPAVEGVEMFRCLIGYMGKSYIGICEATDVHDPFYIEKGCSNASGSVNVGETVQYNPKVYDRSNGEISTGWTFSYALTDHSGNVINDVTEKTLTYENILKYGGISVRIEASKE
jgi:hypothetical protein